jgi:hypothetical protein
MNKFAFVLAAAAAVTAACDYSTDPEPCTLTVQLDDTPISLPVNDSTRVTAHVAATGLCQTLSRRVEWAVAQPFVRLTSVNDSVIQITGLSAGTTTLRARSLARLTAQDSVRVTTAP